MVDGIGGVNSRATSEAMALAKLNRLQQEESFSGLTEESLTRFANDFYTPDNWVIYITPPRHKEKDIIAIAAVKARLIIEALTNKKD